MSDFSFELDIGQLNVLLLSMSEIRLTVLLSTHQRENQREM